MGTQNQLNNQYPEAPTSSGSTATLGTLVNSATAKATPVDADLFSLFDSAASFITRKITWAELKAAFKTYFDTLYSPILANASVLGSNVTIDDDPIGETLTNTDISVTVPVGTFRLEFEGIIDNGAGAFKCDFGGTAVDSLGRLVYTAFPLTSADASVISTNTTNIADDKTFGTVEEFKLIRCIGIVIVTTGGTIIFRVAQNSSNADPTILYAGAHLVLTRLV